MGPGHQYFYNSPSVSELSAQVESHHKRKESILPSLTWKQLSWISLEGEGNEDEKSEAWGPLQAISSTNINRDLLCTRHQTKRFSGSSWTVSWGIQTASPSSDCAGSEGSTEKFPVVCDGKSKSKGQEREDWEGGNADRSGPVLSNKI